MNARYYPGHTPSGCGLQRVAGPGAGFYLKRYCSVEFEQPCEGLGYMPESPPFTPWSIPAEVLAPVLYTSVSFWRHLPHSSPCWRMNQSSSTSCCFSIVHQPQLVE